jgi:hypothetical protein
MSHRHLLRIRRLGDRFRLIVLARVRGGGHPEEKGKGVSDRCLPGGEGWRRGKGAKRRLTYFLREHFDILGLFVPDVYKFLQSAMHRAVMPGKNITFITNIGDTKIIQISFFVRLIVLICLLD